MGYTTKSSAAERVKEQYPIASLHQTWQIVFDEIGVRDDVTLFTDHDIHRVLGSFGVERVRNADGVLTEFFRCGLDDVRSAFLQVKTGKAYAQKRTANFGIRPEQETAVERTKACFDSFKAECENRGKSPRFLRNAKMRFGKTFASYQLAKRMGWTRILILTFKPAVQDAWQNDLSAIPILQVGSLSPRMVI